MIINLLQLIYTEEEGFLWVWGKDMDCVFFLIITLWYWDGLPITRHSAIMFDLAFGCLISRYWEYGLPPMSNLSYSVVCGIINILLSFFVILEFMSIFAFFLMHSVGDVRGWFCEQYMNWDRTSVVDLWVEKSGRKRRRGVGWIVMVRHKIKQ